MPRTLSSSLMPRVAGLALAGALVAVSGCNKAPEGLQITLQPELPSTLDDLTVVIDSEAVDPNGNDEVTYRYRWSVDGSVQGELTEASVSSGSTLKGQQWDVSVSAWDGKLAGTAVEASVTILNTAPTATVEVKPADPRTDDDITLTVESNDIDRDTVSLRYSWSLNGSPSSLTADSLRANRTNKGEVWEVSVFPSDDEVEGEPAVAEFVIANTPPSVVKATVKSDSLPATAASTLTCEGSGWEDIDSDAEGYQTQWYVDGAPTSTDDTLVGTFKRDQAVHCQLTPFDGEDAGDAVVSDTIIIRNAPPSLDTVTIGPEDPKNADTVTATLGTGVDLDGDTVDYIYSWRVGGREVASSDELPGGRFVRDDEIVLWVTPTDGFDNGTAVKSNIVVGGNNIPEILSLQLKPTDLFTDDDLVATITARDADGDDVDVSVEWYVNSSRISHTTGTLNGTTWFEHFDEIYAIVSPDDGVDLGVAVTSAKITVKNTPPTTPELVLDPSEPKEGDDLLCKVATASTDADKDPISYTFAWTVNGTTVTGSKTTYANDTLDASDWSEEDDVVCTATPNDTYDDGVPGEASLTNGFVLFTTNTFIGASGHLANRAAADAKCSSYAVANSITGKNFKIVYSTATEDAKDYLKYKKGAKVYDRTGKQIDGGNLFGTARITLSDMKSYTITGTGKAGTYKTCSGSYTPGTWPICQSCSRKFACGSASDDPFNPSACCWSGTRAIVCMGEL